MRKKAIRIIALLLSAMLLCFGLAGCSSKSEKKNVVDVELEDDELAEETVDVDESLAYDTDSSDALQSGKEQEIVLTYPAGVEKSEFFHATKEAPSEVYMEEAYELEGLPFYFDGIVVNEDADVIDVLRRSIPEASPEEIQLMEDAIHGYTLETDLGPVLVIDVLPYLNSRVKEDLKDDLLTLKMYKVMYNNLKNYDALPTKGDKARVYGFYYGYSDTMKCPVVIYGLSQMAYGSLFDYDYAMFRSDEVKNYKYKNLITLDIPKSWSEVNASGDQHIFYFRNGSMYIDYYEDEDEAMSLSDTIDMYMPMFLGVYDYNPAEENNPDYQGSTTADLQELLNSLLKHQEYTTIGDGAVQAFRAAFAVPNGDYITNVEALVFKYKHMIGMLWFYDYNNDKNTDLFIEDFDNIVKSIQMCGY